MEPESIYRFIVIEEGAGWLDWANLLVTFIFSGLIALFTYCMRKDQVEGHALQFAESRIEASRELVEKITNIQSLAITPKAIWNESSMQASMVELLKYVNQIEEKDAEAVFQITKKTIQIHKKIMAEAASSSTTDSAFSAAYSNHFNDLKKLSYDYKFVVDLYANRETIIENYKKEHGIRYKLKTLFCNLVREAKGRFVKIYKRFNA